MKLLPPAKPCVCEAEHQEESFWFHCECSCHHNIRSDILQMSKRLLEGAGLSHLRVVEGSAAEPKRPSPRQPYEQ